MIEVKQGKRKAKDSPESSPEKNLGAKTTDGKRRKTVRKYKQSKIKEKSEPASDAKESTVNNNENMASQEANSMNSLAVAVQDKNNVTAQDSERWANPDMDIIRRMIMSLENKMEKKLKTVEKI